MTNLFNENHGINPEEREWITRYWILYRLKDSIKSIHKGYKITAKEKLGEFNGMIQYMSSVGDIDEETKEKLYKLVTTIKKKYDLY